MQFSIEDIKILGAGVIGVGNHFIEQIDIGVKMLISLVTLAYVGVKLYRLLRKILFLT